MIQFKDWDKVKLSKIVSTHSILRTNTVEGKISLVPIVGKTFAMMAKSIDPDGWFRHVETTIIQSIEEINETKIQFKTLNSTYELELIS
jgi:hypothetical protein